jgi:TPR repeat protein
LKAAYTHPDSKSRGSLHFFLLAAVIAFSACHRGNRQAKPLRSSCEAGDVAACNQLALRLQKGEYILKDDKEAALLFDKPCTGGCW